MSTQFPHQQIDSKWREIWKKNETYKPNLQAVLEKEGAEGGRLKDKFYALVALPYPSGSGLHVGHMYCFNPVDILARYERMTGKEVVLPIGWDSFGLPAENFAVKAGVHPKITTDKAIENFKWQLELVGFSTDWKAHELAAHWESYYKWTQWIFLQMYKDGFAYRAKAPVNWCPNCQTVLANEQVVNGKCERCENLVIQKDMEQWFMKITEFSERLYRDLDKVDWPESTKAAQRNWIGRSEGAEIDFKILPSRKVPQAEGLNDSSFSETKQYNKLKVFTTRPDTIYGATFMVIAPEHEMLSEMQEYIANTQEVEEYKNQAKLKSQLERESQKEKTGVEIKGIKAINPITKTEIPIFIADYVLNTYGTGAIMAVPAHDERDGEFAKKYDLESISVIQGGKDTNGVVIDGELINSDILNGLNVEEAKVRIIEEFEELGIGHSKITYRLRDWLISRQRYWGCPIPMVYLPKLKVKDESLKDKSFSYLMGAEDINDQDLSNLNISFTQTESGNRNCIINNSELGNYKKLIQEKLSNEFWNEVISENEIWFCFKDKSGNISEYILNNENYKEILTKCNEFVGKFRFGNLYDMLIDNKFYSEYFNREIVPIDEKYLPLKLPTDVEFKPTGESPIAHSESYKKLAGELYGVGARFEFDTMDTFIDSSWYYMRYLNANDDTKAFDSDLCNAWLPTDLYMIGPEHTVLHLMYSRFFTKYFFDKGMISYDEPFYKMRHQGMIAGADGRKMSKRYGNVINPSDICEKYGADTLRVYEMFMGPLEQGKNWSDETVIGVRRFIDRIWNFAEKLNNKGEVTFSLPQGHIIRNPRPEDAKDIWVSLAEGWQDNNISPENGVDSEFIKNIEGYDENRDIEDVLKEHAWLTEHDNKNKLKFVYEVDGKVVGWFGAFRKNPSKKFCVVIYIKREFRNKGIGSHCLKYLFDVIGNRDCYLSVTKGNKAISLYEKFGFIVTGESNEMLKDEKHFLPSINMIRSVSTPKVKSELQKLIKYITVNLPELKFNTCVAEFMKFQNLVEKVSSDGKDTQESISIDDFLVYLKLLAPFAPFITDELWHKLTNAEESLSIHQTTWPTYDESLITTDELVIGVQVNGKLRGEVMVAESDTEDSIKEKVINDPKITKWFDGKEIKKFIYIKGKIVSVVV